MLMVLSTLGSFLNIFINTLFNLLMKNYYLISKIKVEIFIGKELNFNYNIYTLFQGNYRGL